MADYKTARIPKQPETDTEPGKETLLELKKSKQQPEAPNKVERSKEMTHCGKEQIVYIKLNGLHFFENHSFEVQNDEEIRAMVSSVKDNNVTQPAFVHPCENDGYEIVVGHRHQKASKLARYMDMPCIVRNLTDDAGILQMVEHNMNQYETILPSERGKTLKYSLGPSLTRIPAFRARLTRKTHAGAEQK